MTTNRRHTAVRAANASSTPEEDGAPWLNWGAPESVTPTRDTRAQLQDEARKHLEGYGQRMPISYQIIGGLWMLRIPAAIALALLLVWAFLSLPG